MLDVLFKNKFHRKCKAAIKLTKARIVIVMRKRNAMQKYLKNDVVDLLKDGLDINAFGRAEGLFVELNLTSCYELADKFCDYILKNLSVISKQRECPKESQEAVSSLIFAAARFADLPELRDLRSIFTGRYGDALDCCYLSKEFVEKLKLTLPSKEATLKLMQNISTEAGLLWDSKATEQKLYNPSPALGRGRSNVDKSQTRESPKDGKLPYRSNYPKQKKCLKAIQEDITDRKEQEIEPEITSHLPEEFDHKKTISSNRIPLYTKSRMHYRGNDDEGKLQVDSRNDFDDVGTPEGGPSTTPIVKKGNPRHGKKVKELSYLVVDQPDEEERWLDTLLMLYSKKPNTPYFRTGNRESTKSQVKQGVHSFSKRRGASWDTRSTRAADNTAQDTESDGANNQGHIRSTSLQPEMLKGGHVHPKLPDDYDDFLAHLAAIRKEGKRKN